MDKDKVTLITIDNQEFTISYKTAIQSRTLKILLNPDSPFIEAKTHRVELPIKASLLKRAIDYMEYKILYYAESKKIDDFPIGDNEALDLLDVSTYLKL